MAFYRRDPYKLPAARFYALKRDIPVLEIYFSNDTIQLLKDLSISERLNLSGEIYGLYFDKENRVIKYAVR